VAAPTLDSGEARRLVNIGLIAPQPIAIERIYESPTAALAITFPGLTGNQQRETRVLALELAMRDGKWQIKRVRELRNKNIQVAIDRFLARQPKDADTTGLTGPMPTTVEAVATVVAERVAKRLGKLGLPLTAKQQGRMRDDLAKAKQVLPPARVEALLKSIDRYIPLYFRKLRSGDTHNRRDQWLTLRWKLWRYATLKTLSGDELARRREQRQYMRQIIRGLPEPAGSKQAEIEQLQAYFDDPLYAWLHEPMSPEHFGRFKRRLRNRQVSKAAENIAVMALSRRGPRNRGPREAALLAEANSISSQADRIWFKFKPTRGHQE